MTKQDITLASTSSNREVILESVIPCPSCGQTEIKYMPTDPCQYFSINVSVAKPYSNPSRGTVAFLVRTARSPVRLCKRENLVFKGMATANWCYAVYSFLIPVEFSHVRIFQPSL